MFCKLFVHLLPHHTSPQRKQGTLKTNLLPGALLLALRASVVCIVLLVLLSPSHAADANKANKWEATISRFEQQDRENKPPTGGVLFVGSSSIRGWNLDKSFPKLNAINRGFGGSQIADSIQYADRIILPYRPKTIVLYAGDNDIAAGKSPKQVAGDYQTLVKKIHASLPKTKIVFIAIKPSITRWKLIDKIRNANGRIRKLTEKSKLLTYVDVDQPMIGKDGKPREELFAKDGLHLNAKGYELWAELVGVHLK